MLGALERQAVSILEPRRGGGWGKGALVSGVEKDDIEGGVVEGEGATLQAQQVGVGQKGQL